MRLIQSLKAAGKESGQILIMFALVLPLLFIFIGFGIDFGIGFLARAELAKASDATALAVMLNMGKGQTTAKALGQSMFATNFSSNSNLYVSPPTAAITITTGANNEPVVNVQSSATTRTFFIGLAGFRTLTMADFSQATRPPVVLSLVLDKSGSMNDNGGAQALPTAVTDFLGYFINGTDELGEVSFSSIATPDEPISKNFLIPITNYVKNQISFGGATFAYGGLTDANTQVTGVSPLPVQAVQVVVFFTDGWANTVYDKLGSSYVNFGGCSPAEWGTNPPTNGWCNGFFCMKPSDGSVLASQLLTTVNTVGSCNTVNSFTPQDTADLGTSASLTIGNVSTDAKYRAVQYANQMRAAGITVYAIGMGDKIDSTYLEELANDPSSPQYNANLPTGDFEDAPTSSQLDYAFQKVASRIILRLTQ